VSPVMERVQDLRDTIGRHVDLSRQFSRAHIESFQFFHRGVPPGWMAVNAIAMLLVIVNNFYV